MAVTDTYTFQNGLNLPRYPLTPEPASIRIRHKNVTLASDPRSTRLQTRKVGGERIEVTVVYPPMATGDYAELLAFLRYVGGRHDHMAFRMPKLRDDTAYSDSTVKVGEYYNINHVTNANQLVQYLGTDGPTPVVRPLVRAGTTPLLSAWNLRDPYLRCSLKNDVQEVTYADDGFVRLEVDLVERW